MDMEEQLEALEDAMWHASEMIEALRREYERDLI